MSPSAAVALVVIDVQVGFDDEAFWGPRSNPAFESNLTKLLDAFRASSLSPKPFIVHVAHHSLFPDSPLASGPGAAFQDIAQPHDGEPVVIKNVNSAFIGTNLEALLRDRKIQKLYLCGLTTGHCVSTSVRMAANLRVCQGAWGKGEVVLVHDATAAHAAGGFDAETIHKVNVATLDGEFCRAATTEEVVKEVSS
ncbi:putative isochorismatase family hydrolase [Exidia glandulosa HHB12029]|uniref:Putative isochorismatase family hydrolase n=1 Tax=Exidia glandulosa HHB12029 TaxID=1314781 RepID=A0A166AM44_EXIGL|nr:putative isochorismatase family hydrolase [Exidia glandulosa HHB12029]